MLLDRDLLVRRLEPLWGYYNSTGTPRQHLCETGLTLTPLWNHGVKTLWNLLSWLYHDTILSLPSNYVTPKKPPPPGHIYMYAIVVAPLLVSCDMRRTPPCGVAEYTAPDPRLVCTTELWCADHLGNRLMFAGCWEQAHQLTNLINMA
jgi:hypothetical protein